MNDMTPIQRQKVKARKKAAAMSDEELTPEHSKHILMVEAIIREGANRLDKMGRHVEAHKAIAQLHLIESAHAELTAIAHKLDMETSTRSGER